jgi:hypothetical protein
MPGAIDRIAEGFDIDDDLVARPQDKLIPVARQEDPGRSSGPFQPKPGMMQRPAQVIGRTVGIEIGPERVQELLAMEPVAGFQGQEFDNSRSPSLPPNCRWHDLGADTGFKPSKQTYLKYWLRAHGESLVPRVSLPCRVYSAAKLNQQSSLSICRYASNP